MRKVKQNRIGEIISPTNIFNSHKKLSVKRNT